MPPWLQKRTALTAADHAKAALHEARASLAGREECRCRVCTRVEAQVAAGREVTP